MGDIKRTAYLREFASSSQCELMFSLKVELEDIGLLEEDVRAVRQITDTVGSLLHHIVNKVNHSIKKRKNNDGCDENELEIKIALRNSRTGKPVKDNSVLKNVLSSMKNLEFSIFEQRYTVIVNAPLVKHITLPVILYSNFTVQPRKLHVLFAENHVCKFWWYKSKDKVDWSLIAKTYKYKITDDDVDHYLKLVCVPYNNVLTGPPAEVVSENRVEKMGNLPICPFEKRHEFTSQKLSGNNFRVVSYNVLSNRYAETNEQFSYCSPKVLAVDYRKQLIGKELLGYQADIICLQEVDNSLFVSHYKDVFKEKGYMSFYHKKGNRIPEGLACFFDKSRFKKIDDRQIIYSSEIKQNRIFTYLWNLLKVNSDLKEYFMKQMTSLQITVLKTKFRKNQFVIVANTHLFYHPEAELIRILQVNIATTYLFSLRKQYADGESQVAVIFCGDFNCVPSSAVVQYMLNGSINKKHELFETISKSFDLFHNFKFDSACGLPKYTNYTKDFKDCLDYIFVEKNKIKVNNVIPFPSEEELGSFEGLPNDVYPSDHLALVVDLEFK